MIVELSLCSDVPQLDRYTFLRQAFWTLGSLVLLTAFLELVTHPQVNLVDLTHVAVLTLIRLHRGDSHNPQSPLSSYSEETVFRNDLALASQGRGLLFYSQRTFFKNVVRTTFFPKF